MGEKTAEERVESGFTVEDLLALGSMAGSRQLCGGGGGRIARTNVVEVANLLDWVKADELVISSGYPFRENEEALAQQLSALQKRGIAALCLKPRRFRDGLSACVVEEAQRLHFPLIELPITAVFASIVHEVMEEILKRETESFQQIQDKLELLLDTLLKEDNPADSLAAIERIIHNPVMVFDSDNELIVTPESRDLLAGHMQEDFIRQLYKRTGRRTLTLTQDGKKCNVPVHFIDVGGQSGIRILLLEYYNPVSRVDLTILNRISHVLALEIKNTLALKKIRRKYKDQFVQNWLFGRLGDAVSICVAARTDGYELYPDQCYRVAIVNLNTPRKDSNFADQDVSIIRHIIRNLNPRILFAIQEGKLILVVEQRESDASFAALSLLSEKLNYITGKGDMSFCISDPHSVEDLPQAYQQARKISRISARCGMWEQTITYEKLGVLYLLALLPEDDAVRAYKDKFLSPLKAYDERHKSDLLETLRVYLASSCNTQSAAKALHTHYNTVVYRVSNIERLLGLSLSSVDTRLQLHIAFKLDLIQ